MDKGNAEQEVLVTEQANSAEQNVDAAKPLVGGSKQRDLTGWPRYVSRYIAIFMAVFHLWFNSVGTMIEMKKLCCTLAMLFILVFLHYPIAKKKKAGNPPLYDWLIILIGCCCCGYAFWRFSGDFASTLVATKLDLVVGAIAVLIVLEAARRVIGPAIPIIAICFILYALFGKYFPGIFKIRSIRLSRILFRFFLTTEGIWSSSFSTYAMYLIVFVIFGSFLDISGGSRAFNDIGYAIGGRMRGGPAQVAVVSSALMGSISGSPTSNVMTTGVFTIPLMKKLGYDKDFAGGVEAAASTGGAIMPPVMGSVAFLIASTLGIPYRTVILAALMPAILYYVGIGVTVDLEAQKRNLVGIPKEQLPTIWKVLKERGVSLIPVVLIIITLLTGKTALYAGFVGILSCWVMSLVRKDTRMGFKRVVLALEKGSKSSLSVGIACVCCSFIVCVATMTGVGATIAANIISLSGGQLIIALLLIMVIILIMSMGMPSPACYIIVSVVAVPAVVNMGVNVVAAHLFCMWIGMMSNVTPPVCMASFAASSLSGGSLTKTAFNGLKLAAAGLIVPFTFCFNPIMLMQGENFTILHYLWSFVTAIVGVYMMAVGLHGYFMGKNLHVLLRAYSLAVALLLINPSLITDVIGIGMMVLFVAIVMLIRKKQKPGIAAS